MKCKKCGDTINLKIFGMPENICWGCLNGKNNVLNKNIDEYSTKENIIRQIKGYESLIKLETHHDNRSSTVEKFKKYKLDLENKLKNYEKK